MGKGGRTAMVKGTDLEFAWPTWPWQAAATEAFDCGKYKRHVYRVSRQIGKTALLQAIGLREVMQRPDVYWYVAPSYDRCEAVYSEMVDALNDPIQAGLVVTKAAKAGWIIRVTRELTGGRQGELHLKSLGNPEMLRGATIAGLLGDEIGLWEERHWDSILEPMLLVKNGWAVFAGTPPDPFTCLDPDFFPRLWDRAVNDDDWWTMYQTYEDHPLPHVVSQIENKRPTMAVDRFDREYMANFTGRKEVKLPTPKLWGNDQAWKRPPDGIDWAVTIDLADNEKDFGDKAAVICSGFGPGGNLWIIDAKYAKNPSQVLDLVYLMMGAYSAMWVGVQNTGYDHGFRYTLEQAALNRGPLNVVTLSIGGQSKYRRIINAYEPLSRAGKVYIQQDLREFLNEWERFPKGLLQNTQRNPDAHHFDMLDAGAGRVEHWWKASHWTPKEPEPINCFNAAKRAVKARKKGFSAHRINDRIFRMGVK